MAWRFVYLYEVPDVVTPALVNWGHVREIQPVYAEGDDEPPDDADVEVDVVWVEVVFSNGDARRCRVDELPDGLQQKVQHMILHERETIEDRDVELVSADPDPVPEGSRREIA